MTDYRCFDILVSDLFAKYCRPFLHHIKTTKKFKIHIRRREGSSRNHARILYLQESQETPSREERARFEFEHSSCFSELDFSDNVFTSTSVEYGHNSIRGV
ncbi:hypothetical protein EYC84_006277 [Monilinia fructicola]|uniref:Uncharacterized protein n=1 Tax=Monilinia fructicola TaxID=38448 RepID=A0A5M9K7C0_MONFR|nr:hypothetical protein EYC84_006277 [Monilinia fructicola]